MHRPPPLRFGVYDLDVHTKDLRRSGIKVRIADQPLEILQMLLEHPGELVTREQLRERLWPSGTFVDFETGLNSAVRKLREALDDSAVNPRFIETVPRRGYRFIAPVQRREPAVNRTVPLATEPAARRLTYSRPVAAIGPVVLLVLAAVIIVAQAMGTFGNRREASEARASRVRATNRAAYDLFTKGMLAAGRGSFEGLRDAVGYFDRATASQPDFAEAYAALAHAQYQFLFVGPLSPHEIIPKAEAAARKAIELDDGLWEPHRTLGGILHTYYWKWDEGDREFQRARELSRGTSEHQGTGIPALIREHRFAEALTEAERVRSLDPRSFDAQVNVAVARRASGQFDEAISELHRALNIQPGRPRGHFQVGVTYVLMARPQDAIRELEVANNASPGGNPRFQAYLAYAHAAAGHPLEARRIVKVLEARRENEYVSSFGLALIYDALGEKTAALAAFERAYQDRAVEFAQPAQYPPFTTIASERLFVERLRSIGLRR